MPQRNFIDEAVENVATRFIRMKEDADKADVVPVGMERATPDQMREQYHNNPKFRNYMVDEGKRDELLSLFKGQG